MQPDTDVDEQAVGGGETDRATALIKERFPVDEGEVEGTASTIQRCRALHMPMRAT